MAEQLEPVQCKVALKIINNYDGDHRPQRLQKIIIEKCSIRLGVSRGDIKFLAAADRAACAVRAARAEALPMLRARLRPPLYPQFVAHRGGNES